MIRNLIYFSASIIIFFAGLIVYGIILNLREVTLDEAMTSKGIETFENTRIVISRNNYRLHLFSDTVLVKSYKAVFGQNSGQVKASKYDNVTPLGNYIICSIDTSSIFHKKLFLNYPNEKDAAEALKYDVITKDEFNRIMIAGNEGKGCPPGNTQLGADIGIQGIGEYDFIFRNLPFTFNWTNGSVAISNENIDEIYSVININTPVKIQN